MWLWSAVVMQSGFGLSLLLFYWVWSALQVRVTSVYGHSFIILYSKTGVVGILYSLLLWKPKQYVKFLYMVILLWIILTGRYFNVKSLRKVYKKRSRKFTSLIEVTMVTERNYLLYRVWTKYYYNTIGALQILMVISWVGPNIGHVNVTVCMYFFNKSKHLCLLINSVVTEGHVQSQTAWVISLVIIFMLQHVSLL